MERHNSKRDELLIQDAIVREYEISIDLRENTTTCEASKATNMVLTRRGGGDHMERATTGEQKRMIEDTKQRGSWQRAAYEYHKMQQLQARVD